MAPLLETDFWNQITAPGDNGSGIAATQHPLAIENGDAYGNIRSIST